MRQTLFHAAEGDDLVLAPKQVFRAADAIHADKAVPVAAGAFRAVLAAHQHLQE